MEEDLRRVTIVVALTVMASACSPQTGEDSSGRIANAHARVSHENKGRAPSFDSSVDGIGISAVSVLPAHKGADIDAQYCSGIIAAPRSAAGKAVRDAGWVVTGEARAGGYDAVSFVGSVESGTSGTCNYEDGNVALFSDGAIKAIAYGAKPAQLAIGLINAENGVVKIYDGDFLHEQAAEMKVAGNGSVSITPLAKVEKVCGAGLPNIQGMPINTARDKLIKAGWKPVPRKESVREAEDSRAFELAQAGVTEVDSCSGTGMGYCGFDYHGTRGHLSVVTVGDGQWPTVTRYSADCD